MDRRRYKRGVEFVTRGSSLRFLQRYSVWRTRSIARSSGSDSSRKRDYDLSRGRNLDYYTLVENTYDSGRESSSLSAILTSSANDWALSFRITWPRWSFTVASLSPISVAICLLSLPAATSLITSRSRGVSVSKRARNPPTTFSSSRRAWSRSIARWIASSK